jgi:hypothetical protein
MVSGQFAAKASDEIVALVTNVAKLNGQSVAVETIIFQDDKLNQEACFKTLEYVLYDLFEDEDYRLDFEWVEGRIVGIKTGIIFNGRLRSYVLIRPKNLFGLLKKPKKLIAEFVRSLETIVASPISADNFFIDPQTDFRIRIWANPEQNSSSYFTIYSPEDPRGERIGSQKVKRKTQGIKCYPYKDPFHAGRDVSDGLLALIDYHSSK